MTDSGIGLNEEARRRLFEPFFTPYQPLRYEGLGLAAVYGTIKSHGGIINAYSEKGPRNNVDPLSAGRKA